MKIELKETGRIKITLDNEDMKKYDITFAQLDYNQIDTKRIVWELLAQARNQTGFDFSSGNLLVEAFPSSTGGCVLYFTSIYSENKSKKLRLCRGYFGPYIFCFENCEDMMAAVKRLSSVMGEHIVKSQLYTSESKYYLALYTVTKLEDTFKILLCEYGYFYSDGAALSFLSEHAKLLASPKAVEQIAGTHKKNAAARG